jgi:hypothetical protein
VKKREEFEPRVLELWVKTRIPLTRAHVQYWTGASRRRLNKWLDQLVVEGVLDVDIDNKGDMVWSVIGAARKADGPTSFDELERLEKIRTEAKIRVRARATDRSSAAAPVESFELELAKKSALTLADRAKSALQPKGKGKKSLLWSGGLSLFLGPLGWLYAGSFREAVPAAAVYLIVASVIPKLLLMPIAGVALPLSGIAGLIYAWQYNRSGERQPLLLKDKNEDSSDDG